MGAPVIETADLREAVPQALIAELNAELSAMYDEPGANHFRLDPADVSPGTGVFLVATVDGEPVGCGAIRRLTTRTEVVQVGEIKRMYVKPGFRGTGIGRAIVERLEEESRRIGIHRLVLETGTRQGSAIALYEHIGFVRIPLFGEYTKSPGTSICYGKAV